MDDAVIVDCWDIVQRADGGLLRDIFLPLPGLEACLACFDLPALPAADVTMPASFDPGSVKPAFKNVTDDILLSLRHHAAAQTELPAVSQWVEKLMRFCEIRHRDLKGRALKVCHTRDAAQLRLLHLAALLMDQCFHTKDLRLLNTVLKLADLKWVLDREGVKARLGSTGQEAVVGMLQFRTILTTEFAMHQLNRGRTV